MSDFILTSTNSTWAVFPVISEIDIACFPFLVILLSLSYSIFQQHQTQLTNSAFLSLFIFLTSLLLYFFSGCSFCYFSGEHSCTPGNTLQPFSLSLSPQILPSSFVALHTIYIQFNSEYLRTPDHMVCSLASINLDTLIGFVGLCHIVLFLLFLNNPFKNTKKHCQLKGQKKKKKRLQLACQQELPTLLYKKPRRGERINRVMRPDTKTSCPQAGRMNLQSPQYFCHIIASFPPTSIPFLFPIKI